MRFAVAFLIVASFLAGCSGAGAGSDDKTGDDLDIPALDATKTTGVIRALVVDDAIRPVPDATVTVRAPGADLEQVTGANGFAGFEDLEPGTYFVEAVRPGYVRAQTSVEVVAGVDDPPLTRMLLTAIVGDRPFYVEDTIEGFMECGVSVPVGSANVCFIANYYPCLVVSLTGQTCTNVTADNSYFRLPWIMDYPLPAWVQTEMVWESTQSVSEEMMLRVDVVDPATDGITAARTAGGVSPVMVSMNSTYLSAEGVPTTHLLALESFTRGTVGVTVEQEIRYYVHAFYGYTPPEGWLFSTASEVPQPPY